MSVAKITAYIIKLRLFRIIYRYGQVFLKSQLTHYISPFFWWNEIKSKFYLFDEQVKIIVRRARQRLYFHKGKLLTWRLIGHWNIQLRWWNRRRGDTWRTALLYRQQRGICRTKRGYLLMLVFLVLISRSPVEACITAYVPSFFFRLKIVPIKLKWQSLLNFVPSTLAPHFFRDCLFFLDGLGDGGVRLYLVTLFMMTI